MTISRDSHNGLLPVARPDPCPQFGELRSHRVALDQCGIRPQANIFVASKACWHEITDELPRFDEYPPSGAA